MRLFGGGFEHKPALQLECSGGVAQRTVELRFREQFVRLDQLRRGSGSRFRQHRCCHSLQQHAPRDRLLRPTPKQTSLRPVCKCKIVGHCSSIEETHECLYSTGSSDSHWHLYVLRPEKLGSRSFIRTFWPKQLNLREGLASNVECPNCL